MRRTILAAAFAASALLPLNLSVSAQTDELRAATGLPMKIGESAVFGQVTLKKLAADEKKPTINVVLLEGGSQLERVQTNDAGVYRFYKFPRGTATLVIELNNNEVARMVVTVGASRLIRQDFELDWAEAKRLWLNGVVSSKDSYPRNAEAAKAFDTAMKHVKEKNLDKATSELKDIIAKDPKDYVAWTELGTIYFKKENLNDAEACYFKAIELKADYFIALLNLGKLYVSRKQADNAVLVLLNAVKGSPESADAQHFLGEAYLLAKKGSLAVTHLNEAIKLAPMEKAEVHLRLASLYDAAKLKDRASAEYKAFLAKKPDYPEKAKLEKYIAENPPK
ncbi:MAG: tetratricopeptide repeat protein [Pyrinomonadaceae bacterium]